MITPRGGSIPSGSWRDLILAWWLLALLALGVSTAMALVLVVARMPMLGLGLDFFRTALVLHVDTAVLVWFLSVAAGVWLSLAPLPPRGVWLAAMGLLLSLLGVCLMLLSPLCERALPLLANYVPVLDGALFHWGLGAFAGGILVSSLVAASALMHPVEPDRPSWALMAMAAMPAWGAAVLVTCVALARSQGGVEMFVWGGGHLLQGVHVLLLMAAWLFLARQLLGTDPLSRRVAVLLMLGAAVAPGSGAILGLYAHPDSPIYREGFTFIMRWLSWPAPAILGFLLLRAIAKAPAPTAANEDSVLRRGLVLAIALFLLGCAVGALIRGESTAVPAHYHGTVGAITLSYMLWGRSYLSRFGLRVEAGRWWRWQPVVYGGGIALLVAGLAWSGLLGAPRKEPLVGNLIAYGEVWLAMTLAGLGGFLAFLASATYVVCIVKHLVPLGVLKCRSWKHLKSHPKLPA